VPTYRHSLHLNLYRAWLGHNRAMHRTDSRATAALDAVNLARDPFRLRDALDRELVVAAVTLSKAMVRAVDAPGTMRATRAAAVDLLDSAGRAIGRELRRRQ
jgi:hypothetical protein